MQKFYQEQPVVCNVTLYLGLKRDPRELGFQGENYWRSAGDTPGAQNPEPSTILLFGFENILKKIPKRRSTSKASVRWDTFSIMKQIRDGCKKFFAFRSIMVKIRTEKETPRILETNWT